MPNQPGQIYKTVAGDVLDAIVHRFYGRNADAVNYVSRANPHLRHVPVIMPAGLDIYLPDLPAETPRGRVVLWE